jgi:phosphate:Na+ symporter
MIEYNTYLSIIGGLALLLYGIHLSSVNFQKLLGSRLEEYLKKAAGNPAKGLLIGTGITAMMHNSGAIALILIGLISGGFISLIDSIPVLLGANIGSTVATQLASLSSAPLALAILAVGIIIHLDADKRADKQLGETIVGFGFIFLGAQFVFSGVDAAAGDMVFVNTIGYLTSTPFSALLVGALVTVFLHSSSAVSILTVALGGSGSISLPTALYLILGINLGSSLKVIHLALTGKNFSGRLALIHLGANLLGLILFLPLFSPFVSLVTATSISTARQIANANTIYNLIAALIFLPFAPLAIDLFTKRLLPNKTIRKDELSYLDRRLICTPSVSLDQANRAAVEMARISCRMLEDTREMFQGNVELLGNKVHAQEQKIDTMTDKITEYTIQISQQSLSHTCKMKLYSLLHIIADIEHLCDHTETLAQLIGEMRRQGISLSPKAHDELAAVYGKMKIMQNLIIKALEEDNIKLAGEISDHENKVDEIIKKISINQEKRLREGSCSAQADRFISEILYNLERIGDHYDNIAYAVKDRCGRDDQI